MRRGCRSCCLFGCLPIAIVVVGAFVAPAALAADQGFHVTLAPAFALVAPDQHEVSFLLVNSSPEALTINVAASDGWMVPAEKSFVIGANQRHTTTAAIVIPTAHDDGDHEADVSFTVPPNGATASGSMLRVSWAVAARVLINAGGTVVHGLHVFGLSAPWIADSFDAPAVNLTLVNHGNVHELATIAPFGQVLVLRGQTRTVSLPWTQHPWVGVGDVSAGGETVTTLFLPIRAGGGLLAVLIGLFLVRRVRRTP